MCQAGQTDSTAVFPGKKKKFHGFDLFDFELNGVDCRVAVPKQAADGRPWIWRARFFGVEPQFDRAMLERGYHVVYCDVADLFGSPAAVDRWHSFYNYLRFEHLLADRAVLEGFSRGGLIVYNWAAAHPETVACIYADNPVCDFKSWPGGKGSGKGGPIAWRRCLDAYGLSEAEALAYDKNPIDQLQALADADIPLLHVVGDADDVVPPDENTGILEKRYRELGGRITVIHKPGAGHHPHSLEDPTPIVEFVMANSKGREDSPESIVSDRNFISRGDFQNSRLRFEKQQLGHVAFLGGSITEMDGYRPLVCDILKERFPETDFTFTNAGISSTCSDTGAFRLTRDVLSQGPLDLLFVEFAVNDDQDGVYSYADARRGMEGIIAQARRHNPHVDIVMTFFVNENILAQLQNGQVPAPIAAHSRVAEHYDVSVNDLARELASLITAGKTDWKTYGGVHPNIYGNTMCATMIRNGLLKAWNTSLPVDSEPKPYPERPLMDPFSYDHGRFLPAADIQTDSRWQKGVPDWPRENDGMVRARFQGVPMIHSGTPHARLTVDFEGTAIGAYILSGPDAGVIQCAVDGKVTREIDTLHRHSGFNYPMTLMFFTELSAGKHRLELEILENRPGRLKPGGTAFRAIAFTGN
ncbi:MAG: GDSL-type esterase/lipase family protein [Lentisphaeria bacterium]|nr:GDSL-type esterase/lipase family protein [Lentisphaeria bacterium]